MPREPPASSSPTYTTQQVAAAKAKVCEAYEKVHHPVGINMARPTADDPALSLASSATARQALDAGGRHLEQVLVEEPATVPELHDEIRVADPIFQVLTVDYLAATGNEEIDALVKSADQATVQIEQFCD